MGTELQVPEHLRGANLGNAMQDVNSGATASMSVPRISLKGRKFRFVENGQEVKQQNDKAELIIVGVEPQAGRMIKTYYEKGYTPGSSEPPDCASHDGIRPSPWVSKPQNATCADCKWNAFGSAKNPNTGKPTKKCRDAKQLWVKRADDPAGIAEAVIYGLNVSVASLKDFAEYSRLLAQNNVPFCSVVTQFELKDTEFPELKFSVARFLSKEEFDTTLAITNARPWAVLMANAALPPPEAAAPTMQLPGAIPDHLKQATTVVNAGDKPKSADDVINNW